jgi:hypothetical protein
MTASVGSTTTYLQEVFRFQKDLNLKEPGHAATALNRIMAEFGSVERYVVALLEQLPPASRSEILKMHIRGKLQNCIDPLWVRENQP